MSMPHYKISYAQNGEDLILAGILRNISQGFYVDVGANHPELDSVTKIFYDKGWSGINIEPNDILNAALCEQRPRDVNIKAGLSSQPGRLTFRSYDSFDGLSTFSRDTKEIFEAGRPDAAYTDSHIEVLCLADLLQTHRPNGDIHFLKVDVEGLELEVLLGNKWDRFRPWILCIEHTQDIARRDAISTFLTACSYTQVFFDGINNYYVANEKRRVWDDFSYARDIILDGVPVNYIFIKYIAELSQRPPV
jgi:FkbM family methyltransferase